MSELRLPFPANAIAGKGKLTANDVELLKTDVFPSGVHDTDGAVMLFALNNACLEKCAEWNRFFLDSLSDFIVNHTYPQGSLDEVNALWLERMLAADGVITGDLEFDLLMQVMAKAAFVPDSLKVFALSQLRHAIHGETGALARRRITSGRAISEADILFASGVISAGVQEQTPPSPSLHRVLLAIDAVSNPALNAHGWIRFLYSVRNGAEQPRPRNEGRLVEFAA